MFNVRTYILENDPIKEIINFNGVHVNIEWRKGETREYLGSPYKNLMHYDYGFIPRTMTSDKMETDICLYDRKGQSGWVGILTQLNTKTGKFDEYKYMLGFNSLEQAKEMYSLTMEPKMFGGIKQISWKDFLDKILSYRA